MKGSYDDWKLENADDEWDRLNRGVKWGYQIEDNQRWPCENCRVPTLYRVGGVALCMRCQVREGR